MLELIIIKRDKIAVLGSSTMIDIINTFPI